MDKKVEFDTPVNEVISIRFLLENALNTAIDERTRSSIRQALRGDTEKITELNRLIDIALSSSKNAQVKSYLNIVKTTIGRSITPKVVEPKVTRKKGDFVPNAFWAKVRELEKTGLSEAQAKKRAEEIMQADSTNLDSLFLKNQPIAKEGVLPYADGMKLKRWEDLKRNIGRLVPIVDEHPLDGKGKGRLVADSDKEFGKGKIKQCGTEKRLCADLNLDDDAPVKMGYSIGYPYEQLDEPGVHDGERYDSIQANLVIDHIALTDRPRDGEELMVTGDAKYYIIGDSSDKITQNNSLNNTIININRVGYDSVEFVDIENQRKIRDLARKLKRDNPDTTASDDALLERARVMLKNEQELNKQDVNNMLQGADINQEALKEKEEEKEKAEEKTSGDDVLALVKENEKLKAKLAAREATDSISQDLKAAQDALEAKNKIIDAYHQKELKADIDSLIERGFKSEQFDGKTHDFVLGVLFGVENVSKGPNNGKKLAEVDAKDDLRFGRDGFDPGRWSEAQKKWVPHSEWQGE